MPDTTVFLFGMFIFVLLFGGLILTVIEMRRLGREAESKRLLKKAIFTVSALRGNGT